MAPSERNFMQTHRPGAPAAKFSTIIVAGAVMAAAIAALVSGSITSAANTSGLVAAYSFDAGSGAVLADNSGGGNNGTIAGATWTTAGKHAGALSFNGTNSMITIPDSPSLDLTSGMTLEAWVRPKTSRGSWRTVVLKEQTRQLAYALYSYNGSTGPSAHVYRGTDRVAQSSAGLPLNTWSFLSGTYDGSALRLYVNGTLVSTTAVTGPITTSTSPLRIGGNNVWKEWFSGLIDDVRIYNRALSTSEMTRDMGQAVNAVTADTSPPTPPGTPTASSITQTSATLNWGASQDDTAVSGYTVYGPASTTSTTSATSYTISGLACGTSYSMWIDAYDAAANHSAKAAVSFATAACSSGGGGGGGGGTTATFYVSPSGSDAGSCSQAAPCKTFDHAFQIATAGSIVEVAGGTYPAQTITAASRSSNARVVLRAATGATVNVAGITVSGSHLELNGINANIDWPGIAINPAASDIVLRNVKSPRVGLSGHDISVFGSTFGPVDNLDTMQIGPSSESSPEVPTNILLDGNTFHGAHVTDGVSHVECIQTWGVNGLTVRNNRFSDCEHFNMLFTRTSVVGSPTNILIENNFMDCCRTGYFSIYFGDSSSGEKWSNITVRNNSTDKDIGFAPGVATGPNVLITGNIAPSFDGCGYPGVTADYNVWYAGKACGPHDKVASNGYTDASALDFHLTAGAPAIDAGNPASYPSTDIDGNARPQGAGPDAGADERGGSGQPQSVDGQPPAVPANLRNGTPTTSSISLAWDPSTDNVGVSGYGLYRNGTQVGTTTATNYAFTGLTCGTTYTLAVDAADAMGNRSAKASITATTAACGDTQAPTAPTALAISGVSGTGLTLSWSASSDNVGVDSYDVFRDGTKVGTTSALKLDLTGLNCGSTYTLGVEAVDAAGNRSTRTSTSGATDACSSAPPTGASLFLAPNGSDSGQCGPSTPCQSFQRAYSLAQPGQHVTVAAGEYGDESVSGTKSGRVYFDLAASSHLTDLTVHASNLEVDGGKIDNETAEADASGFISRNTDRGVFGVFGADNTSFIGGDGGPSYKPGQDEEKIWISFGGAPGYKEPTNTVIDGVYIHDFRRGYAGDHPECIFIVGGNGITIQNSRFVRCDLFSIFAGTPWFGNNLPPMRNVTIENNTFGDSSMDGSPNCSGSDCPSYSIRFASDWSRFDNFRIAYNSMTLPMALGSGNTPVSNFLIDSNVMPALSVCMSGVTYKDNVMTGGTCSSSDKLATTLGFVNATATEPDMHSRSDSPAINAGDPAIDPATDIDGQARPMGGAPDAGADEVK